MARNDLAKALGLTRAAVTFLVNDLLTRALILVVVHLALARGFNLVLVDHLALARGHFYVVVFKLLGHLGLLSGLSVSRRLVRFTVLGGLRI
jgi:hypothetical protein